MPRPKSIVQRVEVDQAKRAHNCQHNSSHRIVCGDRRLKVHDGRSCEYFCVACAIDIIVRDIEKLRLLQTQLRD
jgi:hypothetical protein